jgi:hypothetical protein
MDEEAVVSARAVGVVPQFGLEIQQVLLQPVFKGSDIRLGALGQGRVVPSLKEVGPGMQVLEGVRNGSPTYGGGWAARGRLEPPANPAPRQGGAQGARPLLFLRLEEAPEPAWSRLRRSSPRPGRKRFLPPGSSGRDALASCRRA